MKILPILILIIMAFLNVDGQGPQLTNVIPPSPNMQAMEQYGDIPVSTYTGIPNISIPLYTIKFRDITIPISISYHASGIKVDEEASQVGLGWVLNAGGCVSRKIVGGDDFDGNYLNPTIPSLENGIGPTQMAELGDLGILYNKKYPNLPTIIDSSLSTYVDNGQPYDLQPDQFYFNIPGRSGRFILDHNGTVELQNQQKIQITYASDGSAFEIQTENGFIYNFNQTEFNYNGGNNPKTAWYLTSVVSPLGSTVTFHYNVNNVGYIQTIGGYSETRDDYVSDELVGKNEIIQGESLGDQQGPTPGQYYSIVTLSSIDFTNGVVQFSYSNNRKDVQDEQRLDSVLVFEKDKNGIVGSIPIKTIVFNYGYFVGSETTNSYDSLAGLRLMLQSLRTIGTYDVDSSGLKEGFKNQPDTEGVYRFTYYDSLSTDILPSKLSFGRDHWGYYNGNVNNASLIPVFNQLSIPGDFVTSVIGTMGTQRDADTSYVRAFSLKDIYYPTGGYTEFQYESNDFDVKASEINDHSFFNNEPVLIPESQALAYDGSNKGTVFVDTLDLTNEYVLAMDTSLGGMPISLNAAFRFVGGTGGNCNDVDLSFGQVYYELDDIFGNTIDHVDVATLPPCSSNGNQEPCMGCTTGSPVFTYIRNYGLPPGKYIWKAYCANSGNALKLEDIHATFNWYSRVGSYIAPTNNYGTLNYAFGGGLRIRGITNYDGFGGQEVKTFLYHYSGLDSNQNIVQYSFGKVMVMPRYSYFILENFDYRSVSKMEVDIYTNVFHLMRSADSNLPLDGSAGGMPVGYDQVTEFYGPNGEYGKTVYKYYNQPDLVNDYSIDGFPMRPPFGSSLSNKFNGDLLNKEDYQNKNGRFFPVREVTNSYSIYPAGENEIYGIETRPLLERVETVELGETPSTEPLPVLPEDVEIYFYPSLQSDWHFLSNRIEKTFDINDTSKFKVNSENFIYNNPNHLQLSEIQTTDSRGGVVNTNFRYPLDFSGLNYSDAFTKGLQTLESNHVINSVIEKYIQRQNVEGNFVSVSSELSSFDPYFCYPRILFKSEPVNPISNFAPAFITSSGVKMDSNYKALIYFDQYDTYGNILQQHKAYDVNQSYIWDYNGSLPVASVVNASSMDIAYTSFESNGTGNWRINDTSRNYSNSLTGSVSFTFNGTDFISDSSLSTSKQYLVSYWSMNGSLTVNNNATLTVGPTKNGWTYFEHKLNKGIGSVIITGSGKIIDELRLYPVDAQMTTYTYDPLVGVTSSSSVNNIVSYYLYDGLGRLHATRDQDGNITKTFDYNYKH